MAGGVLDHECLLHPCTWSSPAPKLSRGAAAAVVAGVRGLRAVGVDLVAVARERLEDQRLHP